MPTNERCSRHFDGGVAVPEEVLLLVAGETPELVWHSEVGGLTYQLGDRFVKWNPPETGVDLRLEVERLGWLATKHPVPKVIDFGANSAAQWIVTRALPGGHAVGSPWEERRPEALAAIAKGLRTLHGLSTEGFPSDWVEASWAGRSPASLGPRPPIDDLVLVHGDACAPNTLISERGDWTGNVDFGDLTVGDRWADLAIASLSIDWNFGEGHQSEFFAAYEIEPDDDRIRYYRALWDMES